MMEYYDDEYCQTCNVQSAPNFTYLVRFFGLKTSKGQNSDVIIAPPVDHRLYHALH